MNAEYGILHDFEFERKRQAVRFVETVIVNDGVVCDVYSFPNDQSKDLGIIKIKPGCATPLQRVLEGERTIEGHIAGKGQLVVAGKGGEKETYPVNDGSPEGVRVDVNVGDSMQWQAAEDSELVAYEICFPPYKDGRYENL